MDDKLPIFILLICAAILGASFAYAISVDRLDEQALSKPLNSL
jgi:hypothetical protein